MQYLKAKKAKLICVETCKVFDVLVLNKEHKITWKDRKNEQIISNITYTTQTCYDYDIKDIPTTGISLLIEDKHDCEKIYDMLIEKKNKSLLLFCKKNSVVERRST